jgi:hypothetical protein
VNHARHVIREALVAALAAGGTAAGARVYDHPTDVRTAWPALVVEDLGERQDAVTMPGGSARRLERRYEVEVTAELQQTTGYARARDQLIADVERIAVTATLTGAKWIVPTSYTPDQTNAGERPIAIGRQRFEIGYHTTQGDPATTI